MVLPIWFARGFTRRVQGLSIPTDFAFYKGCSHRRDAFRHGWEWADRIYHDGETGDPWSPEEVELVERAIWDRVRLNSPLTGPTEELPVDTLSDLEPQSGGRLV